MNRRDVVELFGVIKAIYQNQFNGDNLAVDVWHRLLAERPREHVLGALHDFVNDGGDFPPNCSQILKRTNGRDESIKSAKLLAAECWREILNNCGRTSDPTGSEALRLMGGWRKVGFMPEKQAEQWGRRDFVELYLELNDAERVQRVTNAGANTGTKGQSGRRTLLA